jgi:hypothetical protein
MVSNAKFPIHLCSVINLFRNENGTIYLYELLNLRSVAQKPEHANNTVHPKSKAISLVIRCPCTAGYLTLPATPNKLHNGIRS